MGKVEGTVDEAIRIKLLHASHVVVLFRSHGEEATMFRINVGHTIGDVHGILVHQRLADEEEFGVAQCLVGE